MDPAKKMAELVVQWHGKKQMGTGRDIRRTWALIKKCSMPNWKLLARQCEVLHKETRPTGTPPSSVTVRQLFTDAVMTDQGQANAMAKRAAKEPPENMYSRWNTRIASLAYLTRKTTETRTKATKEWIKSRMAKSKASIPRKRMGLRKNLHHEKKEVISQFYQLLSGHAIIAPYLKEKLRKLEIDTCWWCESGKKERDK
jgi:hypothetical protein